MAENISQKQLELEKQRLVELQKQLKAIGQLNDAQKQQLADTEKAIKATDKRITQAKKKVELQKLENKEFESFARKFRGMSQDVQKQLQGTSKGAAVYLSLGRSISKEKAIQAKYADKEDANSQRLLANSYERESVMSDIASNAAAQAKATQKAEDELRGVSDVEREILDIQNSKGVYNAVQKKQLIEQLKQTEQLRLKEERLKTIKEEQQGLFEALPESIKGAVGFAKKLGGALTTGALPLVLISTLLITTLSSFTKLDEAAKEFRETTGLTNSQMEGIKSQANDITGKFSTLGVEAKDVFNSVAALKSEFSDITEFSDEVVGTMTVLNKNFGVSNDNAAKVQATFERMGGLSAETASSLSMQVVQMSNLAGVAPAKVMADIAESSEEAYKFFKGDVREMAKTAIEARRLGTSLKDVLKTTEALLDFESGIEDELVAATFVGGQFNLSKARGLAYAGEELAAQEEILNQIQRSGDFRKQNMFTQKALAKAAGMEVGDIIKQLDQREKLANLTSDQKEEVEAALAAGFDISNVNKEQLGQELKKFQLQQEQQSQLEQLQNAFMGIASTIGTVLTPLLETIVPIVALIAKPFQWMADGLKVINDNLGIALAFYGAIAGFALQKYWTNIKDYALSKKKMIQEKMAAGFSLREAIAGTFSSLSKIPFGVGLALAAGAVAGMIGLFNSVQVGDMFSPADGKTQVSTKEGGLFELSPNDDLIAAPGLASGGGGGGGNLSAPINAMIGELKALRADMASGKIAVYLDSAKVSSELGKKVDQQTRNVSNIASA